MSLPTVVEITKSIFVKQPAFGYNDGSLIDYKMPRGDTPRQALISKNCNTTSSSKLPLPDSDNARQPGSAEVWFRVPIHRAGVTIKPQIAGMYAVYER